jgi:hypothetical protein
LEKLFFHLLDLTILDSYIVCKSCGGNKTYPKFMSQLIRDLLILSNEEILKCVVCPGDDPEVEIHK